MSLRWATLDTEAGAEQRVILWKQKPRWDSRIGWHADEDVGTMMTVADARALGLRPRPREMLRVRLTAHGIIRVVDRTRG